jgi:hypothetical protein
MGANDQLDRAWVRPGRSGIGVEAVDVASSDEAGSRVPPQQDRAQSVGYQTDVDPIEMHLDPLDERHQDRARSGWSEFGPTVGKHTSPIDQLLLVDRIQCLWRDCGKEIGGFAEPLA